VYNIRKHQYVYSNTHIQYYVRRADEEFCNFFYLAQNENPQKHKVIHGILKVLYVIIRKQTVVCEPFNYINTIIIIYGIFCMIKDEQ
jgi:hypothetical protein